MIASGLQSVGTMRPYFQPALVLVTTYTAILLYLCYGVQSASSTNWMQTKVPFIDLSYLTHIDAHKINKILHDTIQNESFLQSKDFRRIKVDVSSSGLGDSGVLRIIESLAEGKNDDSGAFSSPLHVSLEARMNQISPKGASTIFDRIISLRNQTASNSKCINGHDVAKPIENDHVDINHQEMRNIFVESLDLGFNDIGHGTGDKKDIYAFNKSLKRLIENQLGCCPRILRLDVCGFGAPSCRAIGKGLIDREKHTHVKPNQSLRELYLSGNDAIGDGGLAALAAALKTIHKEDNRGEHKKDKNAVAILDHLDVSSCDIGDSGVEAIALAIDSNPGGCIKRLNLSNNEVTDEGAIALSKALIDGSQKINGYCIDSLDLSNNHGIGDEGAMALFEALEYGALRSLSLRSCSIKWRGAAALGRTLANIAIGHGSDDKSVLDKSDSIEVDISGNHIGKKGPKKKSSVHENVMNGMTFLSKRIKSSLKDAGLNSLVGSSLESDDEAEMMDDSLGSELEIEESKSSKCGALEFYSNLFDVMEDANVKQQERSELIVKVGMRMCNFDERSVEALCASSVLVGDKLGVRLQVDCTLNDEACADEDVVVKALEEGDIENVSLREMAERHYALRNRYEDFDDDDYGYDYDYQY